MASWKEQIKQIDEKRRHRQQCDEQLYATQIKLFKTERLLKKARKQETTIPANTKDIEALRLAIAELEAQLQELSKEINIIESFWDKVNDNKNRIDFLQKKITVVKVQLEELHTKLEEEKDKQPPDQKEIETLEKQLQELKQLLKDLQHDLAAAKRESDILKQQQEAAKAKQKELEKKRKSLREQVGQLEDRLAEQLKPGQQNAGEIEEKKKSLQDQYKQDKINLSVCRDELQQAIAGMYVNPHPRELVKNLDDSIPFLLMPVRIETRFITSGRTPELWLRVYPDDIAIHTHEKILSDKEVAEGEKYWKALFEAEKNGGSLKEDQKKSAWSNIASLFGPQRAAWIALQTKPANWSTDLAGINTAGDLVFPLHDLTKTNAWSRAPRTQMLPDKFVMMLYEGDTIVKEQVGNIIPDELMVGPDPLEAGDAFATKDEKLVFGEAFDWTSDFEKAVQYGMGFKIPLTADQASRGFDKILVLGLYLSANEFGSKQHLEELIDNHHYSPKGFSIIKQGAPTNNTDTDESGYTKNDPFSNISYFVENAAPMCFPGDGCDCDGKNLADALGIDYEPLEHILNCDSTDYTESVAMNTSLYASTLGYYFSTMLQPVLSEDVQDKLRDFFVQYVTGRGPLPAIRVGNQPYGILLTSDFTQWQWQKREPFLGSLFLNTLYNLLSHYQSQWDSLLPKLMHVGKPDIDPSQALMNILGLQSGSVSFYQRAVYSTDSLKNKDDFQFGGKYFADMQKNFTSKNDLLNFFSTFGYNTMDANGLLKVPQQLRLVFQHYQTLLDAANLVDNVPLSEKDTIHNYDEAAKKNYIDWLNETNTIDALEKQDFGAGKKAPTALLYLQLRRALLLQIHQATVRWFGKNKIVLDQTLKPNNFHNIRPQGDVTKWEVMKAKVGVALPDHYQKNRLASEYLLSTGKDEDEAAFLNKIKESLAFLADLPTARLERCFTEHLDTCTYRLDAWQTALFNVRLRKQRQLKNEISHVSPDHKHEHEHEHENGNADTERRKGIYIGSFGWVENVKPGSRRQIVRDTVPEKLVPKNNEPLFEYAGNGGFVHTPSLNQASAAAVLRSGYMSHATAANPDTMAVNISSERVRRALFILQGIRNGQTLEALLGYQFERGLHDRGSQDNSLKKLNLYIYDFRDAFPFQQHQVQQQGTGTPIEIIPANNVVNGVTLAESTGVFPFGATGVVAAASQAERTAIEQEKDKLADTLDAVKDLLLSESVYQMVQGNYDRSGAMVNALKDAHIPPEIDIINTPRGSQFTFTNRVTIHFENLDPNDPANNPWFPIPMTARAKMEPGINKWLHSIIGNANTLVCRVSHTDEKDNELGSEEVTVDKLNFQPIDLVYIIGNELNTGTNQENKESRTSVSELESRIAYYYRQLKALDDEVPVHIEFLRPENAVGKKALGIILPLLRVLKSMITDSRNLHAEDFDPPSKISLADKNNPKGYDAANLLGRVQQMQPIFLTLLNDLNNLPIQTRIEDSNGVVTLYANLKDSFAALNEVKLSFTDITFTFGNTEAAQLQNILIRISDFGLPDSFPQVGTALTDKNKLVLLEQARSISRRMTEADKKTNELLTESATLTIVEKKIEKLTAAGKVLLGDVFTILPSFVYNNEADILQSHNDRAQLLKHATDNLKMIFVADEWLQNVSHVRPKLARWEYIRSLQEIFSNGNMLSLKPVQLPYRLKDSWLAVEFPEKDESDPSQPFNIAHDTLSITIHGDYAFVPAAKQCGLLIDDWTEVIPTKEEVTGITFNYNQPNAAPPQTLLLAVTPKETGNWSWDSLVNILNDTLLRSKLRAVEPQLLDEMNKPELGVLLPALLANFTQYDLDVSLDYRMNLLFFAKTIPLLTATQVKNN